MWEKKILVFYGGVVIKKASLSGGMVWDSNASLKQVRANARISVVQVASGFKKQVGKKGTSDGDVLAD